MQLIVVIVLSYQFWAGPVALLLNWHLSRKLNDAFALPSIVGINLGITLSLMAPMSERWGFKSASGTLYLPWFFMIPDTSNVELSWVGVVALTIISIASTVVTVSRLNKKSEHGAQ